jgi:amidase
MRAAEQGDRATEALRSAHARVIAQRVRSGELSSRALVDAALDRIANRDAPVRAIVTLDADAARNAASRIDADVARGHDPGPLAGLPITIKDMHDTAGLRTTHGLPWCMRRVPREDSAAVARLRAAGAVIVGKTSLPLAGYDWQTRQPRHGVTRNPHDLARTCGGSSGGAAVALALRYAALELGADLAGSIRVPSAFCGVCGLKPSEGLVPLAGHGPENSQGVLEHMVVVGPMGRFVDDLALELEVLAPGSIGKGFAPRLPKRIAFSDTLCGVRADADTRRALAGCLAALESAGCVIERAIPPGCEGDDPLRLWGAIDGWEFARCWPWPLRTWPLRQLFRCGPAALAIGPSAFSRALAVGMASMRSRHAAALREREVFAARLDAWFAGYDAALFPIAATPAFTHRRRPTPITVDGVRVPYSLAQSAVCVPFNVCGGPACALPLPVPAGGLPIGIQCCGPRGEDRAVLEIAAGIEALFPRP